MPTKTRPEETLDSAPADEPAKLREFADNQAEEAAGGPDAAAGESVDCCCRTHPLVPAFSLCLLRKRSCPYAMSFGHQYLCRHPEHVKFLVPLPKHKK
ncbi:hypothetical protein [Geomonas propionica]|uniref:CopL family metal-binding regulatory protein n=1 Tax=Geomonas propionica TaxID=2798582 RepID=A0ABS0YXD7_9BACT|nr:hypothetical protein [Geomonas propionica]MBJ6802132.1 hypothetical protein [Geomonas propionica]